MKRFFCPLLLLPITTMLCGCPPYFDYICGACGQEYDPDETHYCNKNSLFVTPTSFRNGDKVELTYKDHTTVKENGESVPGTAVYFIDGEEVVRSTDAANNYTVTYIPQGLAKGEHLLSAKVVYTSTFPLGSISIDLGDATVKVFVVE